LRENINDYVITDFKLTEYRSYDPISMKMRK